MLKIWKERLVRSDRWEKRGIKVFIKEMGEKRGMRWKESVHRGNGRKVAIKVIESEGKFF